jgi:hypothetical protein
MRDPRRLGWGEAARIVIDDRLAVIEAAAAGIAAGVAAPVLQGAVPRTARAIV